MDYLGIQHYFGYSRKARSGLESMHKGLPVTQRISQYPEGMGVHVDLDDLLVRFYHVEYLISMIPGIFDNLAVEAANHYKIVGIPLIRISLSNSTGKDLLTKINNQNPILKRNIDVNRLLINLVYEFREKIIHQEGLERIISHVGPHWSNLIVKNHQIKDFTIPAWKLINRIIGIMMTVVFFLFSVIFKASSPMHWYSFISILEIVI